MEDYPPDFTNVAMFERMVHANIEGAKSLLPLIRKRIYKSVMSGTEKGIELIAVDVKDFDQYAIELAINELEDKFCGRVFVHGQPEPKSFMYYRIFVFSKTIKTTSSFHHQSTAVRVNGGVTLSHEKTTLR